MKGGQRVRIYNIQKYGLCRSQMSKSPGLPVHLFPSFQIIDITNYLALTSIPVCKCFCTKLLFPRCYIVYFKIEIIFYSLLPENNNNNNSLLLLMMITMIFCLP